MALQTVASSGAWMAQLLQRIQPLDSELEQARRHARTIKACLDEAIGLSGFSIVGSHARKSAIRRFSDVDYFALLPVKSVRWGDDIKNSSTVRRTVRKIIEARFPHTRASADGQAIVVDFEGGEFAVDVVPAFWEQMHGAAPVFLIPDGDGDWMRTSPDGHNRYLKRANESSRHKLAKVAQMLKFWKHTRENPIPVSSFYVEMLLAETEVCVGPKSYGLCLSDGFAQLAASDGIDDPLGISGIIEPAATERNVEMLRRAAELAADRAEKALAAEGRGNMEKAAHFWNMIFNGQFPA